MKAGNRSYFWRLAGVTQLIRAKAPYCPLSFFIAAIRLIHAALVVRGFKLQAQFI